MRLTRSRVLVAVLISMMALPVGSQTVVSTDQTIDLNEVKALRAKVESNASMDDELRTRILELYDAAISSLEKASDDRAAARTSERQRAGLDRQVRAVREQLERPEVAPRLDLIANATVEQAEDALVRERSRLAGYRGALREQERLAEERAKARSDISRRLGMLDQELEELNDELSEHANSDAPPDLKLAGRTSILARREAARSEVEMLRASLSLLEDRSVLIPLETDVAQRRVAAAEGLVALIEEKAQRLRRSEAEASLTRILQLSRKVAEGAPELAPIAAETEELADLLWGVDGIIVRSGKAAQALDSTRKNQADLIRMAELSRRKFEAFGHRGSITRWWPDIPADFPGPGEVAATMQRLDLEIPEMEHRLITLEQKRTRAGDTVRQARLDVEAARGEEQDPELARNTGALIAERLDLLDELIQHYGRYSDQLIEYRILSSHFHTSLQELERFLYSHILWARSVPKPIIPRLGDMAAAAGWLLSGENLKSAALAALGGNERIRSQGVLVAILLVFVVLGRRRIQQRLAALAARVSDPNQDSIRLTVEALVLSALLAAPLPLVLRFGSLLLMRGGESTFFQSAASALSIVASVALLLESIRVLCAPHGLAETHFGWPSRVTQTLHRGLIWPEAIGLPLLQIALHLGYAGIRLDSPQHLQIYNNSLGRAAFVAALLTMGLSVLGIARPERKDEITDSEMRVPWPKRFAEYAFPTALLGAYPMVVLATVVPAVLAVFGFYVTGLLLAYQMLRTMLLALAVVVGGGLVYRWRTVQRRRSMLDLDEEEDDDRLSALGEIDVQVRQLLRFGIVAVMAIGLFSIWADALPMMQMLKRIQLLPRVQIIERVDTGMVTTVGTSAATTGEVSPSSARDSDTGATSGGEFGVGALPAGPGDPRPPADQTTPLTLWVLLEAILAAVVTLMLVRNVPGVIEIFLKSRTKLDGGARFALATLVRYSITIIGTVAVFSLLGITWNNVQWLAAALTFGLGFGLQEIVANFVSGLILLIERPVRVGDVVTIGTLSGRVNRIQIRATTITLWDRSEMIVPNKEFITTKLVNWTLSDSKRRIEIPLRIAYGADVDLVKQMVIAVAAEHPAVLEDPAPHALLLGFGEDSINLELRFVVDFGEGLKTKDEVQMKIKKVFQEHGIEFALPKSEVRWVSGPEPATGA